ncbi:MAG: GSCFA domain-containing protein [Lentisphaerae bacterium]|nr:GSCFA domain-containing protein [Lentisphaerota bacterium]MCP4101864.1 GSCFA domain-containing protein [Lentisphaerota bacterium]
MKFGEIKLQTKVNIQTNDFPEFGLDSVFCGIGSCFSENLINLLHDCEFDTAQNPTGIIYNAYSIMQAIERCAHDRYYNESDFFKYADLYHSWEHHGNFSHKDLDTAVSFANNSLKEFAEKLKKADIFIITPSSSVTYVYKETDCIVANCHKLPNNYFKTRVLTVNENTEYLQHAVNLVHKVNEKCKIIFTLSPVRHYPGDLTLNGRSKANLLAAIHEICTTAANCCYFPSYEIMNDELRDYRFYNPDLLHPNELAIKYICSRFTETVLDKTTIRHVEKALNAINFKRHRRMNS